MRRKKWMWSILSVFALYESTTHVATKFTLSSEAFLPVASYIVFLTVIYRFYVGDNRILNYYYDSFPTALVNEESSKQFRKYAATFTPGLLWWDGVVRVFQYLLFVAAANSILDTDRFVRIVLLLLLVNVVLSVIMIIALNSDPERSKTIDDLGKEDWIEE